MRLEFPSRPENVNFARMAVAMFASHLEFTVDEIDEIKTAVSEAVSNAVVHGYPDTVGPVMVEVILFDDRVEITVADQGCGIADIAWAMEPANSTEPDSLGLGLVFIKQFMDRFVIESSLGGGTRLQMTKLTSQARVQQ